MKLSDYQKAVAGDGQHTYSAAPCSVCGDLDGCHVEAPEAMKRAAIAALRSKAPARPEEYVFQPEAPKTTVWRWNVPPSNSVHVVVSYERASNRYYLGLEDWDVRSETWHHRAGSSRSCGTEREALAAAEQLWKEEQASSGGKSRCS